MIVIVYIMEPTTFLLICMLILAIAGLFCGKCIERVPRAGSAIGNNKYGMSISDRRKLRDRTAPVGEDDAVMGSLINPIAGENPELFDQYLDYGSSYYPHQRFPAARSRD